MQLNDPADPQANNQTLRYPGALHGMMSLEHGSIDTSKELQARLAVQASVPFCFALQSWDGPTTAPGATCPPCRCYAADAPV